MKRKDITSRLDRLVQTCARYRGAKKKQGVWVNKCVTCGKTVEVGKKLHGGHFIPRGCYPTRWRDVNVWPQCAGCNTYKDGAYIEYSDYMLKNYPEDYNELLEIYKQHKIGKAPVFRILDLRAMHDVWLFRGRQLEEKLGESLFPKSWKYLEINEDEVDIEEVIAKY